MRHLLCLERDAGWSSLVARRAHNPKVPSSNLGPATIFPCTYGAPGPIFAFLIQNEERTRNRAARQRPPWLRTWTFHTFVYATATERESWRNFKGGKVDWPTDAAIARHRSVCRETCRPSLASGHGQFSGQVGSRAEVHLVRGLAGKGRMGHLGVVLFNEELHQGAQSCEGIQRVEVQPLMLERAPERLNHGVGEADVDPRENAVKAGAEKGGVDPAVDVLHTGVSIQKRPACGDKMLAGGQENLTRRRGLQSCAHRPGEDFSGVVVDDRMQMGPCSGRAA